MFDLDRWEEIWQTINRNRKRSIMTAFGVFWGIFMLTVMMGSGLGLRNLLYANLNGMNENSCFLWGGKTSIPYKGLPAGRYWQLDNDDMRIIETQIPGIKAVGGVFWGSSYNFSRNDRKGTYSIVGYTPSFQQILPQRLLFGRFFNEIDMEQQRKETREMLDDLTTRDQRMLFAVVTLVHLADSKEELDSDTETLQSIARKHLCQLAKLSFQQQDGLITALPLGLRRIDALRTLTTEALAVLMPFKAQEIRHRHGIYYGQNAISKNLILADRKELLNGNGFILGVSGSGKSFAAKREITEIALSTNDDIIIIDPEAEYRPLVEGLGGEVIEISATSPNHINALDMESGYNDGDNPVVLKSEFLLSLCEQLVGAGKLSAKEKSIIDRCTAQVYREFIRNGYLGVVPTLQDFHAALLEQPEPEARDVALALELFTEGSLNTFAKYTNVDTNSRILCYDIRDLGKQLLPVGMLVVLDSVFNRIIRNRKLGKNTWLYIDEIYLLFQHEYSANFLFTLWKRMRKYGACGTGLTQNVDDLLQSHTARTMLANSEFLLMLNQASTDRIELARLLNISDNQLSYISGVDFGHGLLKCGSTIVPFVDHFPKNGRLYQLMTTKMSERVEQAS